MFIIVLPAAKKVKTEPKESTSAGQASPKGKIVKALLPKADINESDVSDSTTPC